MMNGISIGEFAALSREAHALLGTPDVQRLIGIADRLATIKCYLVFRDGEIYIGNTTPNLSAKGVYLLVGGDRT